MRSEKDISGIVLAGGKSRRMGRDKALIVLKNRTFLEHVVCALKPMVDEIFIVSDNPEHQIENFSRVPDKFVDGGPIAGIYTGLIHSKSENNIVLSCDVPLISSSVLEILLDNNEDNYDVVQLKDQENYYPLIALYKKRIAPYFLTLLNKGERKLMHAVSGLNVKTICIEKAQQELLKNVNTISDLKSI